MKFGITNTTYTIPYGTVAGYERMRSHGYGYADYQGFMNTEAELFTQPLSVFEAALKEERKAANGAEILFSQVHGPWRYPPRESTETERKQRIEEFKRSIYGTAILGSPNWVIHPLMPYGADTMENAERMIEINREAFLEVCDYAKTLGITVCLENMPFLSLPISSVETIVKFVKEMNLDNLKICLDTGHTAVFGLSPARAVEIIGSDLLAALHVHDNDGKRDLHQRPEDGVIDWKAFAYSLKTVGYNGVYSLECAPLRDKDRPESWEQGEIALINTVKRHIG